VSALGDNQLLVSEKIAKDKGWKRGDTVTMKFAKTGDKTFLVGGVYENNQFLGDVTTGISTFEANFSNPLDFVVVVKGAPGVSATELRSAIDKAVKPYPNIEVRTRAEYVQYTQDQVNQMLTLVYALLMLAIIIALIGIMNTMALSVFERTRELGLARAVGMSRRQVRRMIRWESVVVSLLGAVVGLVVGVGFGWALVKALAEQGIESLTIPVGTLVAFLVFAGVAGMGAAIFPARRAARLDVLTAIAAE
jgi:putative ABC transport system permease protein